MEGKALAVIRRQIEWWNAQDMDRMVDAWAEDVIVKPDPYFLHSEVSVGRDATRRFFEDQVTMGAIHVDTLEEDDLGDRCLVRCRQNVEAPGSGVEGTYDWSFLCTVRDERVVLFEFFLDRDRGRAAAGL